MLKIRAGDRQAFSILFERHSSPVYGFCLRTFSGNRAVADDTLQEIWIRVVRGAANYQPRGQFRAWLMTIARNEAVAQVRKAVPLLNDAGEAEASLTTEETSEDVLLEEHAAAQLREAIDSLPAAQRTVLMLSLDGEYSYEELARKLGATVASVRSLLFRARISLKERLAKNEE